MPLTFTPDGRLLFSEEVPSGAAIFRPCRSMAAIASSRIHPQLRTRTAPPNCHRMADGSPTTRMSRGSSKLMSGRIPTPTRRPMASLCRWWPAAALVPGRARALLPRLLRRPVMSGVGRPSRPISACGQRSRSLKDLGYLGGGQFLSAPAPTTCRSTVRRFLMLKQQANAGEAAALVVVLNWFEELKRLVPIG